MQLTCNDATIGKSSMTEEKIELISKERFMSNETETTNLQRRAFVTGAAGASVTLAGLAGASQAQAQSSGVALRDFEGKTTIVTGAARGIGLACADALAARGANVVLLDVAEQIPEVPYPLATQEDLDAAKSQIEAHGVQCVTIKGDVRDMAVQKQAVSAAMNTFGSVDFVIPNAGITQTGFLEELSEEEIDLVLDINLKGVIKTIQAVTPILRQQNAGRIVTMASVTGRMGAQRFPVYSATKWAVIGLTKTTAEALAPHNVTVNALCPTLVRTSLLENDYVLSTMVPGMSLNWEQFEGFAQEMHLMPQGFYGPEHVGNLAAFLCSNGASLISGDVFDIAAGFNARFPA